MLASFHVNGPSLYNHQASKKSQLTPTTLGAVDMDIYGAFQFSAIGILAAVRVPLQCIINRRINMNTAADSTVVQNVLQRSREEPDLPMDHAHVDGSCGSLC